MWRVDGAKGEGGGQLVRIACGLAALYGEEVQVTRIRAGRPGPGLAAQHLAALEALAALTGGALEGARVGATEVRFAPGTDRRQQLSVDVGTAGSCTLLLQALLPACLAHRGPVTLDLQGGTDVKWSPPWDYFAHVFLPHLEGLGLQAKAHLARRGHYPAGGGRVEVRFTPRPLRVPGYEPTPRTAVEGLLHLTGLPRHVADRMAGAARQTLHGRRVHVGLDETEGTPGAGLALWTTEQPRLGASSLGEKGRPAEEVGADCGRAMATELEAGCSLDVHASDQLLPWLAVAPEPSAFTVRDASGHLVSLAGLLGELGVAKVTLEGSGPVKVLVRPERPI